MKHYAQNPFSGLRAAGRFGLSWLRVAGRGTPPTAEYDANTITEARGEVVSVLWRNPHVRFQVSTKSLDGNDQLWEIESADLTRLDRAGLARDILEVGDVVTFAGNPSTRQARRMYATNLLVADGREILLRGNAQPRWSAARVVTTEVSFPKTAAVVPVGESGFIGKVLVPTREGQAPAWLRDPPLTAAAREGKAALRRGHG
jgi:hypothetical protein